MTDLTGRIAVVTGASRGIGRAVAIALAQAGADVAVNYRERATDAIDVVETIHALGRRAIAVQADVSRGDAVTEMFGTVEHALGIVDILINNAGIAIFHDIDALTEEDFDHTIAVNLKSAFLCIRAAVPHMRERGWGRIVNIGSWAVREPVPVLMLSNSHRSAALAAFKTIARGVAASGVTVNTVLPGRIATERIYELHGGREEAEAAARSDVPLERLGTPQEMAAAVAFLCSERAGYITGVGLLVDGGLSRLV